MSCEEFDTWLLYLKVCNQATKETTSAPAKKRETKDERMARHYGQK